MRHTLHYVRSMLDYALFYAKYAKIEVYGHMDAKLVGSVLDRRSILDLCSHSRILLSHGAIRSTLEWPYLAHRQSIRELQ